jgi:nicotinate-nucleotide pyrophosphorylase (carboxylating)
MTGNYVNMVSLPGQSLIAAQVAQALQEDIGDGDLTTALMPPDSTGEAYVIVREEAVLAGVAWFDEVFRQLAPSVTVAWHCTDGDQVHTDMEICRIQGPAAVLLMGERSALNFLQTLSATATVAAQYVAAVAGTGARILDTRKTLPGMRLAQKYAVACGGASNHRMGLYDAVLIKENHIRAAGSIAAALQAAQDQTAENIDIEIEVESLDELEQALQAGAKRILLDNFSLDALRAAVQLNQGSARLEASGGVNLNTVRDIALTGVDDISVGGMTKDICAVDFSMLFATA